MGKDVFNTVLLVLFLFFCFGFGFFSFFYYYFFNTVLTWKIVGVSKVSVLYIYIDKPGKGKKIPQENTYYIHWIA